MSHQGRGPIVSNNKEYSSNIPESPGIGGVLAAGLCLDNQVEGIHREPTDT